MSTNKLNSAAQSYARGIQGAFSPVLMVLPITQEFNLMFKCRNENTFTVDEFQINDTTFLYSNNSTEVLM